MNIETSQLPQQSLQQLNHTNSTIERQNCSRVVIVSPQTNISMTHQQTMHKTSKSKKNMVNF